MFFIGILAEIVVRVKLKEQPITASKVMTGMSTAFNIHIVKYICIVIIVVEIFRWLALRSEKTRPNRVTSWRYTREVCLAVMMVLALYMGSSLRPQMQSIDQDKKAIQLKTLPKDQVDKLVEAAISSLSQASEIEAGPDVAAQIFKINPAGQLEVLAENNPGDQKLKIQFDNYHQRFEWLYAINMILGLTCLYIHAKELTRFKED